MICIQQNVICKYSLNINIIKNLYMYSHRHVGKVLKYQDMAKPKGKVNLLHPLTSKNPKLQRIKQPVIIQLFSNSCSFQNGRLKSNQFIGPQLNSNQISKFQKCTFLVSPVKYPTHNMDW